MRGRIISTISAIVLVALPAVASAQAQQWIIVRDPLPSMGITQWPGPPKLVPLAPSGMPMPTLGLPLPPITRIPPIPPAKFGPQAGPSRPAHAGHASSGQQYGRTYSGRTRAYGYNQQYYGGEYYGQQYYGQQYYGQPLYVPQVYGPIVYPTIPLPYTMMTTTPIVDARQHALPPPAAPVPEKGSVALIVEPGSAQVVVDGYYIGTADEFDGTRRTLMLEPGAHNIELTDTGYETMRFQVMADSSQPIVYRRELTRLPPPQPVPAPAPAAADWKPTPMWAVPGCYLGNIPPREAGLPASCDATKGVRIR